MLLRLPEVRSRALMPRTGRPPDPLSAAAAAKYCGVKHQSFYQAIREKRIPSWPPKTVDDLPKIKDEFNANRKNPVIAPERTNTGVMVVQTADGRTLRIPARHVSEAIEAAMKADQRSMDVATQKGKLIDAEKVKVTWVEVARKISTGVMGLPVRVTNRLPEEWRREVVKVLEDECRIVLTAVSDAVANPGVA